MEPRRSRAPTRISPDCVAPALMLLALASLPACRNRQAPPAPQQEAEASELPKIAVQPARKMLFTYFDGAEGRFETVDTIEGVPEASRGWVRVVDLGQRPGARRDHELVYVADLRQVRPDGRYPYVVVSRSAFEERAQGRSALPSPTTNASDDTVVMYATSWCPACRAARLWLTENGIPFVEKDIEKDPAAAAELMQRARTAGLSTSGVPVISVHGKLLQGFDPARIQSLLGGQR